MFISKLRGTLVGAGMLGAALLAPIAAHGQAQTSGTRFGLEAGFGDHHLGLGVGAFVKFHLFDVSGHPITGRGSFNYFFPSSDFYGTGYHYWEANVDGIFDIANPKSDIKPYIGAGLGYSHDSFSSDFCGDDFNNSCSGSDFGLNVLGGINFVANSRVMPFVEAKIEARSGGPFIVMAGIHLH